MEAAPSMWTTATRKPIRSAEGLVSNLIMGDLLANHVWLIWLVAALGLRIRKITIVKPTDSRRSSADR